MALALPLALALTQAPVSAFASLSKHRLSRATRTLIRPSGTFSRREKGSSLRVRIPNPDSPIPAIKPHRSS
ncbi:exported hypothetical protein [Xanthomonas hortorum pv. vitians]|nr:exported hypothetical protein [Xanthomonas hortorum pv. vitians]